MKKSFLLYLDSLNVLDDLTDEQAGQLLKAIRDYHLGNEITLDFGLKMAFLPFKNQFIRDSNKWEEKKEERSKSGILGNLKRYNIDLYNKVLINEITLQDAQRIAQSRKTSHSDTQRCTAIHSDTKLAVNDNVNVNVNDSVSVNNNIIQSHKNKLTSNYSENLQFYKNHFETDTPFAKFCKVLLTANAGDPLKNLISIDVINERQYSIIFQLKNKNNISDKVFYDMLITANGSKAADKYKDVYTLLINWIKNCKT